MTFTEELRLHEDSKTKDSAQQKCAQLGRQPEMTLEDVKAKLAEMPDITRHGLEIEHKFSNGKYKTQVHIQAYANMTTCKCCGKPREEFIYGHNYNASWADAWKTFMRDYNEKTKAVA